MRGTEDLIQAEIVRAVRLHYKNDILFAVPNGGARSRATGAILKATGVLAGVSDLILIHRGRVIFIEVKTPDKNSRQSESQKDFEKKITNAGLNYWLVTSAANVLDKIKHFDYTFIY